MSQKIDIINESYDNNASQEDYNWLENLLGTKLQIKISDGRIMRGDFMCTDRDQNIILTVSQEFKPNDVNFEDPKMIGLIMVPGESIIYIKKRSNEPANINSNENIKYSEMHDSNSITNCEIGTYPTDSANLNESSTTDKSNCEIDLDDTAISDKSKKTKDGTAVGE